MLLVPSHEAGDHGVQAGTQGFVWENDDCNLDEAKDRADDLTVVGSKEELNGLNEFFEHLRLKLCLEVEEQA